MRWKRVPLVVGLMQFLLITTVLLRGSAVSYSQNPDEPPDVRSPTEVSAAATDSKSLAKSPAQAIYIPYNKFNEVFEKAGRGVFLPYDKFLELQKAAQRELPTELPKIPIDWLLIEADNDARVEGNVVIVTAKLKFELMKKGWLQIPLRLSGAAVLAATIGDAPARVVAESDGSYSIILEHASDHVEQVQLKLVYAAGYERSAGKNSVSFRSPQAPINRWRIRVPERGIKVSIDPMIAASEVPEWETDGRIAPDEPDPSDSHDSDAQDSPRGDESMLVAYVGAAPDVRIEWTPKAEGATGLKVLASVQSEQLTTIDDGALRTRVSLQYQISRSQLSDLAIDVPTNQKVVSVFDPNIKRWSVEELDGRQRIRVELFQPATANQSVILDFEKLLEQAPDQRVSIPAVSAVDADRQQGTIAVRVHPLLRAEIGERQGVSQLDVSELPPGWLTEESSFAFRYASPPYSLAFDVERIQPRVSIDQWVDYMIDAQQISVRAIGRYQIEDAGVFQVTALIPEGFELRRVRGVSLDGVEAAAVDSFHVDETNKLVTIQLARKAFGKVGLALDLHRTLSDPNLLVPTGMASEIELPIPKFQFAAVKQFTGRLIVSTDESLRASAVTSEGLGRLGFQEAREGISIPPDPGFANARESMAFAYTDHATDLKIGLERRKPFVTSKQLLTVRVEEGVAKFESHIFFDVHYSSVKSLGVEVPRSLAGLVRNTSPNLRETIQPAPDGQVGEYDTWTFTGDNDLLGTVEVRLTWERNLDAMAIGQTMELPVPSLRPLEVDRAWGQIMIAKTESLDVQPQEDAENLRPIDPQFDRMPEAGAIDASRAFEFHGDWKLNLAVTRFQLEEVKRTSIERCWIRMVPTRSGPINVQAFYNLKTARQRIAFSLPAEVEFDSQPLLVDGKAVPLERGDANTFYIPLVSRPATESVLVELQYTITDPAIGLQFPAFPEDPAVQKVYLSLYLPNDRLLTSWTGAWANEWSERNHMRPNTNEAQLRNWVRDGIGTKSISDRPFQVDGKMFLFATLRPSPPPDGLLNYTSMNRGGFAAMGLAFAAIVVVALFFLRFPQQVALVAAATIGVLLLAVFAPTLVENFTSQQMATAISCCGIAWVAILVVRFGRGWSPRFASRAIRAQEASTLSATPQAAADLPIEPASTGPPVNGTDIQGGTPS